MTALHHVLQGYHGLKTFFPACDVHERLSATLRAQAVDNPRLRVLMYFFSAWCTYTREALINLMLAYADTCVCHVERRPWVADSSAYDNTSSLTTVYQKTK